MKNIQNLAPTFSSLIFETIVGVDIVVIIKFSTGTHRNVSFITTPTPGNLSGSEMLLSSISNEKFLENISVLNAIVQRTMWLVKILEKGQNSVYYRATEGNLMS